MIETTLPRAPELWPTLPAPDPTLFEQVTTLRLENAALRAQNAALQARICELEARRGQNSCHCSRPPSSALPHVPSKPRAVPSTAHRGGNPSTARTVAVGLLVAAGEAVLPGDRCPVAPPSTARQLNAHGLRSMRSGVGSDTPQLHLAFNATGGKNRPVRRECQAPHGAGMDVATLP
jgi:hypothetical protein